jgi:carbon-monoxide dehydrogenase medium subunit
VLAERAITGLVGQPLSDEAIREAARATAEDLDPPDDIHASPEFRRHLAEVLTARVLKRVRV